MTQLLSHLIAIDGALPAPYGLFVKIAGLEDVHINKLQLEEIGEYVVIRVTGYRAEDVKGLVVHKTRLHLTTENKWMKERATPEQQTESSRIYTPHDED